MQITKGEKVIEGKTKIVYRSTDDSNLLIIVSKPFLTKGDGAVRFELEGKAEWANVTTCRIFELLNKCEIKTHYVWQLDETSFLANPLSMLPFELVTRRVAVGSYVQRNPQTPKEHFFEELVCEIFYKDDSLHDPIIVWNEEKQWWDLHDAHQPITPDSYIRELPKNIPGMPTKKEFGFIEKEYQKKVFKILEKVWWQAHNVRLKDLKIECGRNEQGEVILGDVIDNDSWRIDYRNEEGDWVELSKEDFRRTVGTANELAARYQNKYEWVADAATSFATLHVSCKNDAIILI